MEQLEPHPRGLILSLASRCYWVELWKAAEAVEFIRRQIKPQGFSERSYWRYLFGDCRRPDRIAAVDLWAAFAAGNGFLF